MKGSGRRKVLSGVCDRDNASTLPQFLDLAAVTCFVHGTKVNKVYAEAGQSFTLQLPSWRPATVFKEGWARVIGSFTEKSCYSFFFLLPPQNSFVEAGHRSIISAFQMLR